MKKVICMSYGKENECIIKKTNKEYQVKNDVLNVEIEECFCKECGAPIFDYEIAKKNQIKVYDTYKKKHDLLTSEEIIAIRKKYGLSQKDLSVLEKRTLQDMKIVQYKTQVLIY